MGYSHTYYVLMSYMFKKIGEVSQAMLRFVIPVYNKSTVLRASQQVTQFDQSSSKHFKPLNISINNSHFQLYFSESVLVILHPEIENQGFVWLHEHDTCNFNSLTSTQNLPRRPPADEQPWHYIGHLHFFP